MFTLEPSPSGLRELRRRLRLSQERLAEILGVDRKSVSNWERGSHAPRSWGGLQARILGAPDETWDYLRTPEQNLARRRMRQHTPPGWPHLRCKRHPDFPLVLGVDGLPWCGLCIKYLTPGDYLENFLDTAETASE